MRVLCKFATTHAPFGREAFLSALKAEGFSLASEEGDERVPCIIVMSSLTAELLLLARELSSGGRRRLLGLYTSPLADSELWKLLGYGFSDVLMWRPDHVVGDVTVRLKRWDRIERLVDSPIVEQHLVGASACWRNLLRRTVEVAVFTDSPVLIMGETGTGKELLAQLIHAVDPRPNKGDLVLFDCTTIAPELAYSELFGHERGAYTGAIAPREGALALAAGGTLFLDEVGDLELRLQAQLLRAVQEKTYKPVGANAWRRSDFRLICATNRDVRSEVDAGRFRADLYFRLAGCVLETVPLATRREDIPLLARHFMMQLCRGGPPPLIDEAVLRYLVCRDYPGNVRDLRQLLARMLTFYPGAGPLTLAAIPEGERTAGAAGVPSWLDSGFEAAVRKACLMGAHLKEIGRAAEETAIRITLSQEGGKVQRAAERLGVTDRALQLRKSMQRARSAALTRAVGS